MEKNEFNPAEETNKNWDQTNRGLTSTGCPSPQTRHHFSGDFLCPSPQTRHHFSGDFLGD